MEVGWGGEDLGGGIGSSLLSRRTLGAPNILLTNMYSIFRMFDWFRRPERMVVVIRRRMGPIRYREAPHGLPVFHLHSNTSPSIRVNPMPLSLHGLVVG